jgi:hypothetical protein
MMTLSSEVLKRSLRTIAVFALCFVGLLLVPAHAQTTNASLGGIVSDPTGARLSGANVKLRNDGTHDVRQTKTNREGVFQFTAVPTGTYTVSIQLQGFTTLNEKGIELHPNDVRSLDEIKLQVGEVTTDVDVNAVDEVPTSGEKSTVITAHDIQRLATVGRDVSELLKTQAGFSQLQGGLDNSGGSDPSVVGPGGSGLGNYVGNGATGNGATITSDGANVTDPVSGSSQTQNVNMDMVSEVKIETSNFGADVAKGPTVITAVGKSGGTSYHGSAYIYGRTADLNAEDWYLKFEKLPPVPDHYIYPGFNVGGPILIPGTKFNHSKKLTFWVGGEDYIQRDVYAYGSPLKSYIQALVPTDQSTNPGHELGMRQGNFNQNELGNFLGLDPNKIVDPTPNGQGCIASGALVAYLHVCQQPSGANVDGNGNILNIDPGAYALINGEFPLPTGPTVGGYNWSVLNLTNQDIYQIRTKLNYDMNDNNKFYVVFNTEQGNSTHIPEQTNYSPASGGVIMGGLDTPGKLHSITASNTASANYSHIFSARATNEVFAALSQINTQFNATDPSRLTKNAIGYPYHGIYSRNSCTGCGSDDFPQLGTYSSTNRYGLPLAITPDFSNGPYQTRSFVPSAGDNFSLLLGAHTIKLGIYAERDSANSTEVGPLTNGQIGQYYVGTQAFNDAACIGAATCHNPDPGNKTINGGGQNYLADFFMGYVDSFTQQNFNPKVDMYYWNVGWFVTDSWKATKRLTLDLGLRFDHLGGWTDNHGIGLATFHPELYAGDAANSFDKCGQQLLPGMRWHGKNQNCSNYNVDPNTPLSGTPTRFAFISPRFGIAWDAFGTGKSVVRGGFGLFRGHDSYNDYQYAVGTSEGVITQAIAGGGNNDGISLAGIDASGNPGLVCTSTSSAGCPTVSAMDPTDNEQPLTYTYSFTVTQQMPDSFVFEIGYVGNQSHDLLMDAGSPSTMANIQNINAIPLGGLFQPDPNINSTSGANGASEYGVVFPADAQSSAEMDDYRTYTHYTDLLIPRHVVYANYNALQTSLNKQKGAFNLNVNYTWSRANGVRGGYNNGATQNPTDLRANYGPLGFDRTNIFAASYSYEEGQKFHGHKWRDGFINGWFISGISTYQSGPNLQAIYSPSLAMGGNTTTEANGATCNGGCNLDNRTVLGTPDIYLSPTLRPANGCPTANPTAGLQKHQYINAFCFGIPTAGENGSDNLGYLHGPSFYSNDLSVQRTVPLSGQQNLQFRVSAFNFLNHPITSFNSHQSNEASLEMSGGSFATAGATNVTNTNGPSCSDAGSTCFGYAGYKTGRRVMEMSMRYNF